MPDRELTSMNDRVAMTVLECAPDLPRELPRRPLPESAVADDVVEHLSSRDVLERHVVVVRVDHHLRHPTDVRVVQQQHDRSLADRTDLLGGFLGDRTGDEGGGWRRGRGEWAAVRVRARGRRRIAVEVRRDSRYDLDGDLGGREGAKPKSVQHPGEQWERDNGLTFAPEWTCVPSLTFPMLPAPSVLPR